MTQPTAFYYDETGAVISAQTLIGGEEPHARSGLSVIVAEADLRAMDIRRLVVSGGLVVVQPAGSAEKAATARAMRDGFLSDCDWTQLPDSPLSTEAKAAWAAHRQALRDITEQPGFPASVEWPVAPA